MQYRESFRSFSFESLISFLLFLLFKTNDAVQCQLWSAMPPVARSLTFNGFRWVSIAFLVRSREHFQNTFREHTFYLSARHAQAAGALCVDHTLCPSLVTNNSQRLFGAHTAIGRANLWIKALMKCLCGGRESDRTNESSLVRTPYDRTVWSRSDTASRDTPVETLQ